MEESGIKMIISAAIVIAITVSTSALSARAETPRPFSVTKLCNIASAPEGFREIKGFFTQLSPYYETPYEVYENTESTAILISNMKDGCWVRIDSKQGAWKASATVPAGFEVDFKETRSRALAASKFNETVSTCNDSSDPEASVQSFYFYELFQKTSTYDQYTDPCSDCETKCYGATTFGTASIRLDQVSHMIIADIVVGVAIVGAVQ